MARLLGDGEAGREQGVKGGKTRSVCSGCRVHVSHACILHYYPRKVMLPHACMQVDAKMESVKNMLLGVLVLEKTKKRNAVVLAPRTGFLPEPGWRGFV